MRLLPLLVACLVSLMLFLGALAGAARFASDFHAVAARPHAGPTVDAGALACEDPSGFPCI